MPKNYLNISKTECITYYPKIIENSDQHFKIAVLLFDDGYYGSAISHQVLGAEELLKGLLIYLEGLGFGLRRFRSINRFIRDHKFRHFVNSLIEISAVFTKMLMPFAKNVKAYIHGELEWSELSNYEKACFVKEQLTEK